MGKLDPAVLAAIRGEEKRPVTSAKATSASRKTSSAKHTASSGPAVPTLEEQLMAEFANRGESSAYTGLEEGLLSPATAYESDPEVYPTSHIPYGDSGSTGPLRYQDLYQYGQIPPGAHLAAAIMHYGNHTLRPAYEKLAREAAGRPLNAAAGWRRSSTPDTSNEDEMMDLLRTDPDAYYKARSDQFIQRMMTGERRDPDG